MTRLLLSAFNVIVFLGLASQASAGMPVCLKGALQDVIEQYANEKVVDETMGRRISALFERDDLTSKVKASQAFDLIVSKMIQRYPEADQIKLRAVLQRVHREGSSRFDAKYDPEMRGIYLFVPEQYFETILQYNAMVHEFTHAIQDLRLAQKFPDPRQLEKLLRTNAPRVTYMMEKAAIAMEWEFLHYIPQAVRQQILEQIAGDRSFSRESKDWALGVLRNASLDKKQFITRQADARNYSAWKIFRYQVLEQKYPRFAEWLRKLDNLIVEKKMGSSKRVSGRHGAVARVILPAGIGSVLDRCLSARADRDFLEQVCKPLFDGSYLQAME